MKLFHKLTLIATFILLAFTPAKAFAYELSTVDSLGYDDILITPAKVEVSLNQGESKTFKIIIANRLSESQNFKIDVIDIEPSTDSEEVVKIKEEELSEYVRFIRPELSEFTLLAGQAIALSVFVDAPLNASSGGHSFGLLVSASREEVGAPAILRSRIGVVTLVKIGTDFTESGELKVFTTKDGSSFFAKDDIETFVSFENTGDVHLNPYGQFTVTNMFGGVTETYEIKPWFVLPNQTRTTPLQKIETDWKFGLYTFNLELNRGYDNVIDRKEIKVFVISMEWLSLIIVFLLILAGIWWRARKYSDGQKQGLGILFYLYVLVLIIALLFMLAFSVFAERATSTNYVLERDSINIGGERSTSTTYIADDTLGEVATGRGTSTTYILNAGYQQLDASYISITSPSDISLAPNIHPTNGGTADGNAQWTIVTNSPNGYSLSIKANQSPAMRQNPGADSFADYTPAAADPDYDFTVPSGAYEFGYSPNGANITSRWKNNGSACNVGATITNLKCWDGHSTTNALIASSASGNYPTGATTSVNFRAESNAGEPEGGDYQATLILTAVAL